MRIVFSLREQDWQTTKSLGILHVSTRILRALAEFPELERIDVLANRSLAPELAALRGHARCRLHFADLPAPRRWARVLWDQWSVVRACDRLAPDWLLLPKGFSPLLRWPRARVSAFVHDDVFGHYARHALPFPRGEAALFQRMLRRTAVRADAIVANSAFTAEEFRRDFRPRAPVVRIGAPVAASPQAARPGAAPALLVPTSPWPHKLTAQAVAWLEHWTAEQAFVGDVHGYGGLPRGLAWPRREGWMHHGRVTDEALAALATAESTLVYFSAYEGYGLPPVEAVASGRRAIASDLPPLRETLPAACLFDNADYASFARTLSHALQSPPAAPRCVDTARDVAAAWLSELRRNEASPT